MHRYCNLCLVNHRLEQIVFHLTIGFSGWGDRIALRQIFIIIEKWQHSRSLSRRDNWGQQRETLASCDMTPRHFQELDPVLFSSSIVCNQKEVE